MQACHVLEWLPVRLTAMTFAIVGDFEDAIHCWRTQAAGWPDPESGILLASGAGALGVRLGMPIPQGGMLADRAELGVGDDADADSMQSAIGSGVAHGGVLADPVAAAGLGQYSGIANW